jgi:hypothetical protein
VSNLKAIRKATVRVKWYTQVATPSGAGWGEHAAPRFNAQGIGFECLLKTDGAESLF